MPSLLAFPISSAEDPLGAAPTPYAWERVLEEVRGQRDQLSMQLESARSVLRVRAQTENPDFLAGLYLERPRRSGYQVVPTIEEDPPLASVAPGQRTYSLEVLRKRGESNLREAVHLTERLSANPNPALAPLVIEFERLRGQLSHLEEQLAYHSKWQRAVVEQGGFFAKRNRIAATAREMQHEMQTLQASGGSAERVAMLRQSVQEQVTQFAPTTGLAIEANGDGIRILSVVVYTDLEDDEFLKAFREGVGVAFTRSEAARNKRFAVSLEIRRVTPAELYPEGAPARGTAIDVEEHLARFPQGALILTTGAETTHARVGRNIIVGPNPITRRTLAHEFGHLLGFSDAYLRSYQGDSRDPYGVVLVEWIGLIDNLMGNSESGRLTEGMVETLFDAYAER